MLLIMQGISEAKDSNLVPLGVSCPFHSVPASTFVSCHTPGHVLCHRERLGTLAQTHYHFGERELRHVLCREVSWYN